MPTPTARQPRFKRKPAKRRVQRKDLSKVPAASSSGSIPASFLAGLKDIEEGRLVDMEQALHEPHPGQKL
jgi:hypothetical protein